ncbi:MAG: hypothetical protein H5T84_10565 [Thermoleophilia bacterium]|nr:hypothetical protein [Thermoleophilia bacterium]
MVKLLQAKVAAARFERDLRLASTQGCPFPVGGPLLAATPSQVVLLTRSQPGGQLELVEWEVVGQSLMRRRGPCPVEKPMVFPHSLYTDNKTMLEGVEPGTVFHCQRGNLDLEMPLQELCLGSVTTVSLYLAARQSGAGPAVYVEAAREVGR